MSYLQIETNVIEIDIVCFQSNKYIVAIYLNIKIKKKK